LRWIRLKQTSITAAHESSLLAAKASVLLSRRRHSFPSPGVLARPCWRLTATGLVNAALIAGQGAASPAYQGQP